MRTDLYVDTLEELKVALKGRVGHWKMYGGYNTHHQRAYVRLESQDGKNEVTIFLPV